MTPDVVTYVTDGLAWFPQDQSLLFYKVKGYIGLAATLALLAHMHETWGRVETLARRLRYYALLAAAVLLAGASVEQVHQNADVNWRNIGGMIVSVIILVAAVVSIVEDRNIYRDTSRDTGDA